MEQIKKSFEFINSCNTLSALLSFYATAYVDLYVGINLQSSKL